MSRNQRRWVRRQLVSAMDDMDDAAMPRLLSAPRNYRCLWLILITLVVIGSLVPLNVPSTAPVPGDKWQHFLGYATLAVLAMLSFARLPLAVATALAMIGLGAAIESVQYFLPWRQFEWLDLLANTLGVAGGVTVGVLARLGLHRYADYPA